MHTCGDSCMCMLVGEKLYSFCLHVSLCSSNYMNECVCVLCKHVCMKSRWEYLRYGCTNMRVQRVCVCCICTCISTQINSYTEHFYILYYQTVNYTDQTLEPWVPFTTSQEQYPFLCWSFLEEFSILVLAVCCLQGHGHPDRSFTTLL